MTTDDVANQILDEEEGNVQGAYLDSKGLITAGRGVCIDSRIDGCALSADIVRRLNDERYSLAVQRARAITGFDPSGVVRQGVVICMCYQLGTLAEWLGFKAAFAAGQYVLASQHMLFANPVLHTLSAWHQQTPHRCERMAKMMASGTFVPHV